jgi:hypothetical protein
MERTNIEYCCKTVHENIIMLEQVGSSLHVIQFEGHLHSFLVGCYICNLNGIYNTSATFSRNFTVDFLDCWCKCISPEDTGHIS